TFSFNGGIVQETLPIGEGLQYEVTAEKRLMDCLREFGNKFDPTPDKFKFSTNGLFGYIQYDTLAYFEDIKLHNSIPSETPMMQYSMYQNIIVVDHYKNELHLFEHRVAGGENPEYMDEIETLLNNKNIP